MKKLFVAAMAVLSLSSSAFAIDNEPEEGVTVQAVAGMSVSNINGLEDYSGRVGGAVGIKFEYMLPNAKGTYLNAGLEWAMKGAKYTIEDFPFVDDNGDPIKTANYINTLGTNYVQLPIHLGFRYNLMEDLGVYADFGPYLGLGIAGKSKNHVDADGSWTKDFEDSYAIFKKSKSRPNFQRFDAGLGFRIGVEYDNHYSLNLGCDWGLSDMWRDSYRDAIYDETGIEIDQIKNFNLQLTLGYRF